MSIIYLLCCATQFVCIFSPLKCLSFIVYIFWPPTNQLSRFPGVSHNGQAPPVLHFLHDIFVPLFLLCPCPSPAADSQLFNGLMVYSTAKLNFSFPSFSIFPSFWKQRLVNRCHSGSSGEQSSLAANLCDRVSIGARVWWPCRGWDPTSSSPMGPPQTLVSPSAMERDKGLSSINLWHQGFIHTSPWRCEIIPHPWNNEWHL